MEQNMTALVSLFARAYHQKNKDIKIFDDLLSTKLITEKEYEMIGLNMSQGISFFNPTFKGSEEEALKWIVDHQLSPSVLVRSAFCKEAIEEMKEKGCQQYLDFASGYDSFAYYYQNQMHVFEIDKKEVIEDKRQRCKDVDIENIQFLSIDLSQDNWINTLLQSDYQEDQLSISSMLGLSYYLTKADESMKAKYSFAELKEILNQCHLTIIQHENHQTVTEKYISNYNVYYKDDPIKAPEGVCYCVVEK